MNGVMYITASARVVALNSSTGKEVWSYTVSGARPSTRGVAYWPGDKQNPPRIIFTAGRNLIALNANTGKIDPGFGKEGMVDMVIGYGGVPTVFRNVITVGAAVLEVPTGPPGDTRAYDARTGAKLWDFHTVPGPGEVGHETWLNDGWKDRSGTNIWAWPMTADAQRGILYMTIDGPASNYYGGDRPGANLFGNSLVAVDAETGKLKWYFQTVHHDLWDYDNPPARGAGGHHGEWQENSGDRRYRQNGMDVHPESRDRQAGVRRGRAQSDGGRCPGRVVFADAAVPGETAAAGAHGPTSPRIW